MNELKQKQDNLKIQVYFRRKEREVDKLEVKQLQKNLEFTKEKQQEAEDTAMKSNAEIKRLKIEL